MTVRRRQLLKSTGAAALVPFVQLSTAATPTGINEFQAEVIEFDVDTEDGVEIRYGSPVNSPPIVTEDAAYVSEMEFQMPQPKRSVLAFDQIGSVDLLPPGGRFTPILSLGVPSEKRSSSWPSPVEKNSARSKGIQVNPSRNGVEVGLKTGGVTTRRGSKTEVPTTMHVGGSVERGPWSVDADVSITDHGILDVYSHPDKTLVPYNSELGRRFTRHLSKQSASGESTTVGQGRSTLHVTRVDDIDAFVIDDGSEEGHDG